MEHNKELLFWRQSWTWSWKTITREGSRVWNREGNMKHRLGLDIEKSRVGTRDDQR